MSVAGKYRVNEMWSIISFVLHLYFSHSIFLDRNLMHCLLWNSVKRYVVGSEREKDLLHKISAHALHDKLMISNGHSFFMFKIDLSCFPLCIVGLHMSFVTRIWILITQRNIGELKMSINTFQNLYMTTPPNWAECCAFLYHIQHSISI